MSFRTAHESATEPAPAVAEVRNQAVATSGAYERGDHIRVPGTGAAAYGLRSATVVGPDLGTADAYSTAAFALGPAAADWCATLPAKGYGALLITADQRVLRTANFPLAEDRLAA